MSIPENHVVSEGRTLRAAIDAAAERLGVPAAAVEHKIDLSHFRSAAGSSTGAETVKIFAWARDPQAFAPAQAAEEWMRGVLDAMGRAGAVRADLQNGTVIVHVDVAEGARHLVGRGGATLRALQHLLERAVGRRFPDAAFRIDVARPPEEEGRRDEYRRDEGRRDEGRRDEGRREGGGWGARERRSDGGGDRRRGERRHDGDRRRRGDGDVEDLKRLARKLAEKVLDTGTPETIRRELNSFDRRIVHVEVAAIPGVATRSVGEGNDRRVEIYVPAPGEGGEDGQA